MEARRPWQHVWRQSTVLRRCPGHTRSRRKRVRGKGLMIGAELITDRESRKPAAALCQRVLTRAFHNGLILLSCGVSTLRFIPPLLVSRENVDEAMGLLEISLKEAMVE